MSRPRRKHQEEAEEHEAGMERWLLTYSDMITLLLALFVVLFAVSTITPKKFLALALGLHEAFNPNPSTLAADNQVLQQNSLLPKPGTVLSSTTTTNPIPTTTTTTVPYPSTTTPGSKLLPEEKLSLIAAQIDEALTARGLEQYAAATLTHESLVVQILADHVFFTSDSASLGTVGDEVVDTIASVLATDSNYVVVEGFTDDQPIYGGPYTTNMELSAERAVNVVVRLYANDRIAESRLAAIGYGPERPVVPNSSPTNMAENRRIDVVILAPGQAGP